MTCRARIMPSVSSMLVQNAVEMRFSSRCSTWISASPDPWNSTMLTAPRMAMARAYAPNPCGDRMRANTTNSRNAAAWAPAVSSTTQNVALATACCIVLTSFH